MRAALVPVLPAGCARSTAGSQPGAVATEAVHRVRPGDPAWPSAGEWDRLAREVGGRLIEVQSPLVACRETSAGDSCAEIWRNLRNPYYIGDEPGLTQTSGWVDAWVSAPSAYAVAAARTEDVVAAVNFARANKLRLVVKGGGHSYQGTSSAPDSLLIWTRAMNRITLHDAFVAAGCEATQAPQPAVTVGAGAIWMPCLRCGDHQGRALRAGRWVRDRGGRGADSERRIRQFLESVWPGRRRPPGGRDRHRRRRGPHRECLHASGPVLGNQGRRGRHPRRRHPAHAPDPRAARHLWRRVRGDQGDV